MLAKSVETDIHWDCIHSLGTHVVIRQRFWGTMQLNMMCSKVKNFPDIGVVSKNLQINSLTKVAWVKFPLEWVLNSYLLPWKVRYLKYFKSCLTHFFFLPHFGVCFALLLKLDFFLRNCNISWKGPQKRIRLLNELIAHKELLTPARIKQQCAVETEALLKSVAEFFSILMESGFHLVFLLPLFSALSLEKYGK